MIKFNTAVYLNINTLLGGSIDLRKEVEETLSQDDAPLSIIYEEMDRKKIDSSYLTAFNNSLNVMDHVTVHDEGVNLDKYLTENADENIVVISVPCEFDEEKYCTEIAKKRLPLEHNGWTLEEREISLYMNLVGFNDKGEEIYGCIMLDRFGTDDEEKPVYKVVANSHMSLSDYGMDHIESCVQVYYKNLQEIKDEYKDSWQKVVIRCLFECEADHNFSYHFRNEWKAVDKIIEVTGPFGSVSKEQRHYIEMHDYSKPASELYSKAISTWLITVTDTGTHKVRTEIVEGTEAQVKEYLVYLQEYDHNWDDETVEAWICGTKCCEGVGVNDDGTLHACGQYRSYYLKYLATPFDNIAKTKLSDDMYVAASA